MYRYDEYDRHFLDQRVAQYRDQVRRRLAGQLSEEEFRPLRLMNGLYLQLHAYMLRISIPYGTMASAQLRKFAHVARRYDRGYGHFTTRTNIQYNWIKLEETPDILADLATAQLHGIQTSGNSFRNITGDPWAGVAADEIEDPRPYCELIRQWSALHPEFSFLPRKFKIGLSAAKEDRVALRMHDLALRLVHNEAGETGFAVMVGGGLGRTPILAETLSDFVPRRYLFAYIEAVMRVYNLHGRRDNLFKARIKILVQSLGIQRMREEVEREFAATDKEALALPDEAVAAMVPHFLPPPYTHATDPAAEEAILQAQMRAAPGFARWMERNVARHKEPDHAIVTISLKPVGKPPGDCSAEQMELVADLADALSFGEIRLTHEQNLVLPHIRRAALFELWQQLDAADLGTANIGLASAILSCPGLDYCSLANTRSIPVAQRLSELVAKREDKIGRLDIKISGCINACGHHHIGHIGILGVDKNGEEFYQITLGGASGDKAALGKLVGPAVSSADVTRAVDSVIDVYLDLRAEGEGFPETYRRVGVKPFKDAVYAPH